MFVFAKDVSAAKQVIATLLAIAVLAWTFGSFTTAEAANLTNVSDTMSDTSPAAPSDHTITFTLPTPLLNGEDIVIDFDAANGFDLGTLTATDVTVSAPDTNFDAAVVDSVNDTVTLTRNTSDLATSTVVTIVVGGTNKVVNPTPTGGNQSFEIDISAGTNTGHTRVVVLETVLVTAQVLTSFDFTVYGLATSTDVNGETTTGLSSSTTLPYGTLTAGSPEVLGQDLTVATNAANGFSVTVEQDGLFDSSTGAIIDDFQNGVIPGTPQPWGTLSPDINDRHTWGHWGVTTEDATLSGGDTFSTQLFTGVSSTSPLTVFYHDGPADGVEPGIGSTSVAYKVEISALQEAGDDYNTTLTYIATPIF